MDRRHVVGTLKSIMKKLLVLCMGFFLLPIQGFAREHVVINDQEYTPPPRRDNRAKKRPSVDLDEALGELENSSTQVNRNTATQIPGGRPQNFTKQGVEKTQDIVRAQRENQRNIQTGGAPQGTRIPDYMADPESQYRKLGNLYYMRMLMEAEDKLTAIRRKRVLDTKKFEEETSIKADTAELEKFMGLSLPGNAQPLPVINPPEPKKVEPPKPRNTNEEPPLRVVGIQGYKNKFTAQIMNNGGITNVSPGMNLENGVQVIEISEDGVKVRRTKHSDSGETQTEVITLPLSR